MRHGEFIRRAVFMRIKCIKPMIINIYTNYKNNRLDNYLTFMLAYNKMLFEINCVTAQQIR